MNGTMSSAATPMMGEETRMYRIGEVSRLAAPLRYRIRPRALKVIVPAEDSLKRAN